MNYFVEPQKRIKVIGQYDVAVVGGGIAGVSAALAASRNGAKVILVEKQYMLGGLATAGLVTMYLPLCDGLGKQVGFGICEELLLLSIKHGCEENYPKAWIECGSFEEKAQKRYKVQFNASIFAILVEKLLVSEGVEILYGTTVCSVNVTNNKIDTLLLENKSGRTAITIKSVVDSTGDADICLYSGEKTAEFVQGNVLAAWYYCNENNKFKLKTLGFCDIPDKYKKSETQALSNIRYKGLEGKELSNMMIASHTSIFNDFIKKGDITNEHFLANIAITPQIRMTRRIDGCYVMDDTKSFQYFDDSVGMFSDWRKVGPIYELPFSTLHGTTVKNLISAGRCISVTDSMWDITRVIPVCAISGEAAGTAAAMSTDFDAIDIKELQSKLSSQGVKLHINELSK